jgi:hypothetical protein
MFCARSSGALSLDFGRTWGWQRDHLSNVTLQPTGAWTHHDENALTIATYLHFPHIGSTARSWALALESHRHMRISALRLAREIAARLSPVVPSPFRVSAAGAELRIEHPHGWDCIMPLGWLEDPSDERSVAELAELAVGNALNSLQDAVSEASREPWPPLSPDLPRVMAPYETRFDGTRVRFWYGRSEDSPAIAFSPIMLRDVVQGH